MLSSNNILSPGARARPLATPTQDMILGAYYLTYGPEAEDLAEDRPRHVRPRGGRTCSAPRRRPSLSYEGGVVKLHDIAEFPPLRARGRATCSRRFGRIIYNDRIERCAPPRRLGDEFRRLEVRVSSTSR